MTITPEDVAKLAAAATPGPWRAFADETAAQVKGFPCIEADNYEVVGFEGMYGHYETDWANATFIAAAHDMAALIAEQEAKLKKAVEALSGVMVGGNHLALLLPDNFLPAETEPLDALDMMGAGDAYEVWCCWRSIMVARTTLANIKEKNDDYSI